MSTFRASLAKWAWPVTGLFLVFNGGILIFRQGDPVLVALGVVSVIAGLCAWAAS